MREKKQQRVTGPQTCAKVSSMFCQNKPYRIGKYKNRCTQIYLHLAGEFC